jgi:hypothetical protein
MDHRIEWISVDDGGEYTMLCLTCGDIQRGLEWLQLALDDSHVVRYHAVECQCSYRLVEVEVVESADVDR